jgi:hypothetical protein
MGELAVGDCAVDLPSSLEEGDVAPTVPCAEPHSIQVIGMADLTDLIWDPDDVEYTFEVEDRCYALAASLDLQDLFEGYVAAWRPTSEEWDRGSRVAMCVVFAPELWTGSALDQTALPAEEPDLTDPNTV